MIPFQEYTEIQRGDIEYNGELLIQLCAQNELRINNTFFQHKWQYKRTWGNTREQESILDYIKTNRKVLPNQILNVRTLNSSDLGKEDHRLVLCKYRSRSSIMRTHLPSQSFTKYNVESFANDSTKTLYAQRLSEKIKETKFEIAIQ